MEKDTPPSKTLDNLITEFLTKVTSCKNDFFSLFYAFAHNFVYKYPKNYLGYYCLAKLYLLLEFWENAEEMSQQALDKIKNHQENQSIINFLTLIILESLYMLKKTKELDSYIDKITASRFQNEILSNFNKFKEEIEKTEQLKIISKEQQEKEVKVFTEFLQNFEISSSITKYYVLSQKWIEKWKLYVNFNNFLPESGGDFMENDQKIPIHPGPIIDESLIDFDNLKNGFLDYEPKERYSNLILKNGKVENIDFIVIDEKLWIFLMNNYKGVEIERLNYGENKKDFKIELWLKSIKCTLFSKVSENDSLLINISKFLKISDLEAKIKRILKVYYDKSDLDFRLWKTNENIDFLKNSQKKPTKIGIDGVLLDSNLSIEDSNIANEEIIIIECMINNEYVLRSNKMEIEAPIQNYSKITFAKGSKKGIAGLQNLGNTCFMNSGLQCLSNCYELTKFFLDDSFKNEINETNKIGTKGKLATKYSELVKELWLGTQSYVSPWDLKKVIARFASQFEGYSQQDSQELVSYLLDGLHEDLNRIKNKPIVNGVESDNRSDEIVAKESWDNHLLRNQSKIVDLFHGQYKSTIECPQCHYISITFDPFHMISLPIPNKEKISMHIYFIDKNYIEVAKKIKFNSFSDVNISLFKERIAKEFNIDSTNNLELCILNNHKLIEIVNNERTLRYLDLTNGVSFLYNTGKNDFQENQIFIKIYFKQENDENKNVSYTRLFYIDSESDVSDLLLKIYEKLRIYLNNQIQTSKLDLKINLEENEKDKLINEYKSVSNIFYQIYYLNSNKICINCKKDKCKQCILSENLKLKDLSINNEIILDLKFSKKYEIDNYKMNLCKEYILQNGEETKISKDSLAVEDCIELFTEKEILSKDNSWYCTRCKKHMEASKIMEIYKAPPCLIFHLKRFKRNARYNSWYASSSDVKKIDKVVEFPLENFNLSQYILETKNKKQNNLIYDLWAVSNHYGGLGGGHYTAYARNEFDNEWYEFNDSRASRVGKKEICSSAAYVLFYKLKK